MSPSQLKSSASRYNHHQHHRPRHGSKRPKSHNVDHEQSLYYCPSLTWRLDPDESLSDWILTVVAVKHLRKEDERNGHMSGGLPSLPEDDDLNESKSFGMATTMSSIYSSSSYSPSNRPSTNNVHQRLATAFSSSSHSSFSKKYFVHRTQLGVGPRRSEYFAKLFQNHQSRPHSLPPSPSSITNGSLIVGKTRIELHPMAAKAFPTMLDFMYSPVGTPLQNVTTETAVALRQLATCFGIRELFDAVTAFIQNDMTMHTAPKYLAQAEIFSQEKVASVALQLCAKNLPQIKISHLAALPPHLFEEIIMSPDLECASEVLSTRVAAYCRCRPGDVDASMLQRMTDARLMPRIAPEESIFYLRLLDEIMSDHNSGNTNSLSMNSERGKKALAQTSDFYKRCVEASHEIIQNALLADNKKKKLFTVEPDNDQKAAISATTTATVGGESRHTRNTMVDYRKLSDFVKVDVLESALVSCPSPSEVHTLRLQKSQTQERHANETVVQMAYLNTELDRVHKMYEKKMAHLKSALDAQEQEIRAYLAELSKFQRVPNDYRVTPLLSEYTYSELPEVDQYGECVYGEVAPDDFPRYVGTKNLFDNNNNGVDGWVYHEAVFRNDGRKDTKCWPMYFYKGDFQLKS